jgi:hypothetical protein
VIVVSPPLEYVETLNAGSLFDKLTSHQTAPTGLFARRLLDGA